MDLRSLPDGLTPIQRCEHRRQLIEKELGVDLPALSADEQKLGHAEEKNCEQMYGHVPVPVGLAGPLQVSFSSHESTSVHLPLATTEGALVASVNRGCKAISTVETQSTYHGMSRSLAFACQDTAAFRSWVEEHHDDWKKQAESSSGHLKLLDYTLDENDGHVFLTINCHTDEAMGMNMTTIAAQAIGDWISTEYTDATFVTVAGNIDSDKKPSVRTHKLGRGYEVIATAELSSDIIENILKTTPYAMLAVSKAKLEIGSEIAGALGKNLHAANIVAALYLAIGQDAAHVVEGSLTDTTVSLSSSKTDSIRIQVRMPAVLIGVRGGGTTLPAQAQNLGLILREETSLHPCAQLAESIGAAVLAGEVSLLAAQASHQLTKAHKELGR